MGFRANANHLVSRAPVGRPSPIVYAGPNKRLPQKRKGPIMFVAKVTGAVVATQKTAAMVGHKLLVVEPYRLEPQSRTSLVTTGRTFVAVDTVGAGQGEFVLITQGSSARLTPETKNLPIDTVIIGIVDKVHVDSKCVFERETAQV
jgi:microcompartment protein CcmK/EutM